MCFLVLRICLHHTRPSPFLSYLSAQHITLTTNPHPFPKAYLTLPSSPHQYLQHPTSSPYKKSPPFLPIHPHPPLLTTKTIL